MLSNGHFYWGMFRKYCLAFAHIVNDVHVLRTDANGATVKDITVPVTYAQKSKLFYYLQRRESHKRKVRTMLPRISFVIDAMTPDPTRKMSALNECVLESDGTRDTIQYAGKPWNFNVSMSMWAAYMDDLLQIIEQVATFFNPDYSLDVVEIPEFGVKRSVPIILDNIDFNIENEFDVEDRVVRADATFTLKGWLYPPTTQESLIKHMYIWMRDRDSEHTSETIVLDWDEINDEITTTIVDGQPYYNFASSVPATASTASQLSKQHWFASTVNILGNTTDVGLQV